MVGDSGPPVQGGDLSGSVMFADATDVLTPEPPDRFTGRIAGFAHDPATGSGDMIDLAGVDVASVDFSGDAQGGVLTARDAAGDVLAQLDLVGQDYTHAHFGHATDHAGGSLITTDEPPCFLAGTSILTDQGPMAVEQLRPGDQVVIIRGGHYSLAPVTWIGTGRALATRWRRAGDAAQRHR